MAEYTSKKFLDQTGLVQVFKKIKANYGSLTDVNTLKDAVEEINKKIGDWKASTETDFQTIAAVIASLQSAITIINGDETVEGSFKKAIKEAVDKLTAAINASKTTIQKGGNEHLTLTSTTDSSTSAVTYTIDLVDVASESGLTAEVTRATAAEQGLDTRVTTLETTVGNAIVDAKYNETTKAIDFKTGKNETISIDAKPFIKDGMVEKVEVKDGNLVITFNTFENEPTHTVIEVPISDIFNAENYYTKNEIDGKQFVQWSDFSYNGEDRKTIQLKNHDSISGIMTDGKGGNLIMMSKWNTVDIGTTQAPLVLNVPAGKRPSVEEPGKTGENAHKIAYVEDIEAYSGATDADLTAIKNRLDTLEGDNTTEGSVKKAAQDVYDAINSLTTAEIDAAFEEAMGTSEP